MHLNFSDELSQDPRCLERPGDLLIAGGAIDKYNTIRVRAVAVDEVMPSGKQARTARNQKKPD
jgi:hypothetical protein